MTDKTLSYTVSFFITFLFFFFLINKIPDSNASFPRKAEGLF